MSNMSYCRFQNTVKDLRDCYDNMDEIQDDGELSDNDQAELRCRKHLIELSVQIALNYGHEVGVGVDFIRESEVE